MKHLLTRWGAPGAYVAVVIVVGLSMVAIVLRSPDTKQNFQPDAGTYDRTELAVIGETAQFLGLASELRSTGAALNLQAGCAGCHGLNGEGGAVGPAIWKTNAEDLLDVVREGDSGMPVYPEHRLTDEQAAALSEYLNAQRIALEQNATPADAR